MLYMFYQIPLLGRLFIFLKGRFDGHFNRIDLLPDGKFQSDFLDAADRELNLSNLLHYRILDLRTRNKSARLRSMEDQIRACLELRAYQDADVEDNSLLKKRCLYRADGSRSKSVRKARDIQAKGRKLIGRIRKLEDDMAMWQGQHLYGVIVMELAYLRAAGIPAEKGEVPAAFDRQPELFYERRKKDNDLSCFQSEYINEREAW